MRIVSAVVIAAAVAPLALALPAAQAADPSANGLRVIPQIAQGQLVAAPNARQIVPMIGPQGRSASVSTQAQKVLTHAGSYIAGIASAVRQAVAVQQSTPAPQAIAASPTALSPQPAAPVTAQAPAAPDAPQLVRGPEEARRPAAPVLIAAPRQVARVASKAPTQKIAVYTCRIGQDYSLKLGKCVPEAKSRVAPTAVAEATSGVTAVRTVARVTKSGTGTGSGSVLAGRIDSSSGRMALGVKAQRK